MKKYMRKSVVIEAVQLTAESFDEVCDFLGYTPNKIINPEYNGANDEYLGIYIKGMLGIFFARLGDYIIKRANGEFYAYEPGIFEKTYIEEPE
jgi:hypothetical protein